MEHKKLLKIEQQCTFVYIMNFTIFCKFLGIFAALRSSFKFFTIFFRDSDVCLERYDSYGDFGYLTKNQTFLIEEKFVKEHTFLLL